MTTLPDVASLMQAIRSGAVGPETALAVGKSQAWQPARAVAAYREAQAAVQTPAERFPPSAAFDSARGGSASAARSSRTLVLLSLGVITVLGLGIRRYLGGQGDKAPAPPKAQTVTGLRANSRLRAYSFQFGDSVALELRRLQDWLARQHFGARLSGPALKQLGSLRAAQAASAEYAGRVDSVSARSDALAQRLVARADSIEGAAPGFDGLATALEDEVALWERDFKAYLQIQRDLAAVLDSLPAFLLDKQASFAIWKSEPAFLSREDAGRYEELKGRFANLIARERAWSSAVLAKRPDWMTGLLEDDRPSFERPVLAAR